MINAYPITIYRCPLCGSEHENYDVILDCVISHPLPIQITRARVDRNNPATEGYPDALDVVMSDGAVCFYHLVGVTKPEKSDD